MEDGGWRMDGKLKLKKMMMMIRWRVLSGRRKIRLVKMVW